MILFLKKNIYALKFILLCFTKYKLYKYNSIFFIFRIYFIKVFFSYAFFRSYFFRTKKSNYIEKKLFEKKVNSKNILNQLENNGISSNLKIKKKIINQIFNEINQKKNLVFKNKINKNLYHLIKECKKNKTSRAVIPIDLKKNKKILELITNNFFKDISKNYLNTDKVIINCSLFLSLPKKNISQEEKTSSAQAFHFDNDFSKFLKLYIYLNDVNLKNGPHIYVKKTHKKKLKKHTIQKSFSDKQIFKSYNSFKKVVGKKGSLFLEDSFGFHKAITPIKNYRVILNIHYGNSNLKYSKYDQIFNFNY